LVFVALTVLLVDADGVLVFAQYFGGAQHAGFSTTHGVSRQVIKTIGLWVRRVSK